MMTQSALNAYLWGVYIWFAIGAAAIGIPAIGTLIGMATSNSKS
jgi:hypothetical protein